MSINTEAYQRLKATLGAVTLVAVSKTKPVSDIQALYDLGHRDFGENYVQELVEKETQLPKDIRWHFIGHLQTNKTKYIAPFVHLIHGVDSLKLLQEIDKQGRRNNRIIDCLLQVHIASEETKFGLNGAELNSILPAQAQLQSVRLRGLMGMASFSGDPAVAAAEFRILKNLFDRAKSAAGTENWNILSMGMSGDYETALREGSTLVRIGSLLFGGRG